MTKFVFDQILKFWHPHAITIDGIAVIEPSKLPISRQLLRIEEVRELTKLGTTSVYKYIQQHGFPAPIRLGASSRWIEEEVHQWLDARSAQRAPRPMNHVSRDPSKVRSAQLAVASYLRADTQTVLARLRNQLMHTPDADAQRYDRLILMAALLLSFVPGSSINLENVPTEIDANDVDFMVSQLAVQTLADTLAKAPIA